MFHELRKRGTSGCDRRICVRIVSGGQSGVDRAALDVAIAYGIPYGGWCPRGGWAEDMPTPPGVLAYYPLLRKTPLADPAQRTEWNVRDADATLIIVDAAGISASPGTGRAQAAAEGAHKPLLILDITRPDASAHAAQWLCAQLAAFGSGMTLGIGGPRESEAPGIYARARTFIGALLESAAPRIAGA
jgi:hypothetical protein